MQPQSEKRNKCQLPLMKFIFIISSSLKWEVQKVTMEVQEESVQFISNKKYNLEVRVQSRDFILGQSEVKIYHSGLGQSENQ